MKVIHKKGILLIGLFILSSMFFVMVPGRSQSYVPEANQSYVYEVKYSLYPFNYPDTSKMDLVETGLIRVDIHNVQVGKVNGTFNPDETSGVIMYSIYSLIVNKTWNEEQKEKSWTVNSSSPGVYGNVGFVDGNITMSDIVQEMNSVPIMKPNMSLDDAGFVYYKNRFEGNINMAFKSTITPSALTNATAIWIDQFEAFGDDPAIEDQTYSITITFKDDILESYVIVSTERPQHVVLSIQRIDYELEFPEEKTIDGFPFAVIALGSLVGMLIALKKRNISEI